MSTRWLVIALGFAGLTAVATSCKDEVLRIVPVASVEVRGPGGRIAAGQVVQYTAVPRDDRGNALKNRTVSWSSSNPAAATVDGNGRVTGVLGGSAVITATSEGISGTAVADVDNPTPRLDQVIPPAVPLGSVNPQLRLIGAFFVQGATVRWNGSNRPTSYVSSTELVVTLTTADAAAAGSGQVSVVNPPPGGALTSAARAVNVEYPLPTITSITPDAAQVQSSSIILTVTGTGFFAASRVHFNGAERTTTLVNSTTLRTTISSTDLAAPGYASVTVVNPSPGGGTSGEASFVVGISTAGLPRLATADASTCAVTLEGEAYCWGQNQDGRLGDGTFEDRFTPAPVVLPPGTRFVTVSASDEHACALDVVGGAWCWGEGLNGRLGNGSTSDSNVPVPVDGGRSYVSIAAGFAHTCAVEFGGTAWCWGSNTDGGLGDGSGSDKLSPTRVAGGQSFRMVTAGSAFSCGVTTNNTVFCWGRNGSGRLGDGTTTNRATPVQVQSSESFSYVTGSYVHACAITTGGGLRCWGAGTGGKLGNGSSSSQSTPVAVSGIGSVVQVHAGWEATCAVSTSGTPYCWGSNDHGQLGDGTTTSRSTPTMVAGLTSVRETGNGDEHSCGLTSAGDIYCWGFPEWGQLGIDRTAFELTPQPVSGGPAAFMHISPGGASANGSTCGLSTTGRAYCWGYGLSGQLGSGSYEIRASPQALTANFASIDAGYSHACGSASTGQPYCWGWNAYGQLGDGTTTTRNTPVAVAASIPIFGVSAGYYHSCGINLAFGVSCWGRDDNGQLGNGTGLGSSTTPTSVVAPALVTFVSVGTGIYHSCALASTGNVYCWGANEDGQLGNGTTTSSEVATEVIGVTNAVSLQVGWWHACALISDGTVWCWGFNGVGELGTGQTGSATPTPVQVSGGHNFRQIATSRQVTCGVDLNDAGFCWGYNFYGQAGTGSRAFAVSQPTPVTGGLAFQSVNAGPYHGCGITTAGKLYCWGWNEHGQLGIGQLPQQLTPARVTGGFGSPVFLAMGARRGVGLATAGTTWQNGIVTDPECSATEQEGADCEDPPARMIFDPGTGRAVVDPRDRQTGSRGRESEIR